MKKSNDINKNLNMGKNVKSSNHIRLKALEKKIRHLEIENTYLKKLRRLDLSDPEFLEKTKLTLPMSSESQDEH